MRFDDILGDLGDFGKYQKRKYLILCLQGIFCGMQMLVAVFTLNIPNHRCAVPELINDTYAIQSPAHEALVNETIPWTVKDGVRTRDSCTIYKAGAPGDNRTTVECNAWVYDTSIFKNTVITELNMVCGERHLRSLANSVLMAGLLCGSLLLGIVSDYFGRKPTLMMAIFLHIGTGIGTAFAPNFAAFVALRFLNGASNIGLFVSSFVIGMELVGPSKRTFAGMVIEFFWCLGLFLVGALAYFIRDWHHLQLAISCPAVLLFAYYWLVPESPRWLLSRGREKEAEKILRKAAEVNGVTLPEKLFDKNTLDDDGPQAKITEMFTSPVLLIRTLIIFFNWLVASMVFYGLGLNVGNLGGDVYLNFTIANIVELFAYILCILLLDRLGRKILHCGSMLVGGIACLGTIFPVIYGGSDVEWVTITLSMIGKFGASAAFAIIYIFAAELFPTVVRNSGMGGSSFSARIGGILSPYVADLGTIVGGTFGSALPLIVFGGVTVLAGILALWLPETLNRKLPETIEDAKKFGKTGKNSYELSQEFGKAAENHDNPAFVAEKE